MHNYYPNNMGNRNDSRRTILNYISNTNTDYPNQINYSSKDNNLIRMRIDMMDNNSTSIFCSPECMSLDKNYRKYYPRNKLNLLDPHKHIHPPQTHSRNLWDYNHGKLFACSTLQV